ncbi:hypothetical protein SSX86_032957 [Deinandra increscens subsp. villosa]|uniref:Uncharacterized protein n=1 Tax=Deinandra increscens subsp. villosa TaxID=3103831 RepID=A0AAP0C642_9ASTR
MDEIHDNSIQDCKLCGNLCVILSIAAQNQSGGNAVTETVTVNTCCDVFRDGSVIGFASSNGVVLSLNNSTCVKTIAADGEDTSKSLRSEASGVRLTPSAGEAAAFARVSEVAGARLTLPDVAGTHALMGLSLSQTSYEMSRRSCEGFRRE